MSIWFSNVVSRCATVSFEDYVCIRNFFITYRRRNSGRGGGEDYRKAKRRFVNMFYFILFYSGPTPSGVGVTNIPCASSHSVLKCCCYLVFRCACSTFISSVCTSIMGPTIAISNALTPLLTRILTLIVICGSCIQRLCHQLREKNLYLLHLLHLLCQCGWKSLVGVQCLFCGISGAGT